jgi:hypothetical protein
MEKIVYLVLAFQNDESIQQTAKVFEHYQDALAYSMAISTNTQYDDVKVLESIFY